MLELVDSPSDDCTPCMRARSAPGSGRWANSTTPIRTQCSASSPEDKEPRYRGTSDCCNSGWPREARLRDASLPIGTSRVRWDDSLWDSKIRGVAVIHQGSCRAIRGDRSSWDRCAEDVSVSLGAGLDRRSLIGWCWRRQSSGGSKRPGYACRERCPAGGATWSRHAARSGPRIRNAWFSANGKFRMNHRLYIHLMIQVNSILISN